MKKFSVLLFLTLIIASSIYAQKDSGKKPDFDAEDFSKKTAVAEWLVKYDWVAWKTSDEVMKQDKAELAKLGQEWFCFQDKQGVWHAVYGKLETGKFEAVFHFTVDAAGKITRTTEKLDDAMTIGFATALSTARAKLKTSIPAGSPLFNQYIKRNDDKTFTVWLLPAFQPDGSAVFGGEAAYTIDSTGAKISKEDIYFQKTFRAFKTGNPREIWLDYRDIEKPTLGGIFFVLYYKDYFTKIVLDTSKSSNFIINEGGMWVNIVKDVKLEIKP